MSCEITGKTIYRGRADALGVCKRLNKRRGQRGDARPEKCPHCGNWHIFKAGKPRTARVFVSPEQEDA